MFKKLLFFKMRQDWKKFCLLFWKNCILQIRSPVQTFFEILAPILFFSLLVLMRSLVDVEEYEDGISYPTFQPSINETIKMNFSNLAWSPHNPALKEIMGNVAKNLRMREQSYENREMLQSVLTSFASNNFAGIEFDDSLLGNVSLSNNLKITIRFPGEMRSRLINLSTTAASWMTNLLFPLYLSAGPRSINANYGGPPYYEDEGFLRLQEEVSLSFISFLKNQSSTDTFSSPDIWMRRYPYPRWINDNLLTVLETFVGLIVMLSFSYSNINIVRCVTAEKEKLLKETMKIMGLPGWLHWTAWFVKQFLFLLISVIIIIIFVKVRWYSGKDISIFTSSDPTVLLVLFIPYISSIITFSFLISVFFSKAAVATAISGLVWFLSYAPYSLLRESYISLTLAQKLGPCIFANTAVAYGFQLMIQFEGNDEGFQWENIWQTASTDDNLVLGHILLMLTFDAIFYMLLALYVEAVFPGKYGVPQKWYYLFTSSYWFKKTPSVVDTIFQPKEEDNEFLEKEPKDLKVGIKIQNLSKVYKNEKVAVNDLTLNIYEDQITVLLGHNGAGKTTTMSMLTGIYTPTRGTAIIEGHDIRTDIEGVRNSLGLCPQQNVLFNELTVRDHLYFYSKLKGLSDDQINDEIEKYLELLELKEKENARSSTLSGGMQRKLCVGIALCGNSKFVILDEPSAGVDPTARRSLWDLLQTQKKGRTILLTTHYMDEADLLGDRIAIMAEGKLQCCGSSFFLKKKFGTGYNLVIDKMPGCDVTKITNLLKKYIPDVAVKNNAGSELTYLLDEQKSHVFEGMLDDLENNSEELKIRSYGISLTTLEEVFMKVGSHSDDYEMNNIEGHKTYKRQQDHNSSSNNYDENYEINSEYSDYLKGFPLWRNQFFVMFLKRLLSTYRSLLLMIIQIILPVFFLVIAMVVVRLYNQIKSLPSLQMTLDDYEYPITLVNGTNSNVYYEPYKKMIRDQNHVCRDYGDEELSQKIVQLTANNTPVFRRRYITSASFNDQDNITAWFSNIPNHAPSLSLNLVLNSILKKEINSNYSINVYNHPLPLSINTRLRELTSVNTTGFQLAFNLGFSMAFVTAFYILFYIRERATKAKHLQYVAGVNSLIFWAASFLNDIITFVITVIFILVTLVCFQERGFSTFAEIGRIFSVFLLFAWAVLPLTYLASFCFSSPSTGFTRITLFNTFLGVSAFLVIQVLSTEGLGLEDIADTLNSVFLIVPHYSLSASIYQMNEKYSVYSLCNEVVTICRNVLNLTETICWGLTCSFQHQCCSADLEYYGWENPGIGRNMLYSIISGCIFVALIFLIDSRIFQRFNYAIENLFTKRKSNKTIDDSIEDVDVLQEKQRIKNATTNELRSSSIALRNLSKYYGKLLAVNNICLTVDQYECFGLLGLNGAGKTTTFKMMTGDIMMSSGDAWVNKISLKDDMSDVYKNIGYCPQFDALLDNLTGRETLRMFSMLKGISYQESDEIAIKLAQDFDFIQHLDKQVRELSGGNKRKLSTAVALVGDPLVIYLDEPSTGMDPATKRHLWNVLNSIREKGKCLVLTSHSMEECEALCTRLAIMVNGEFKCIGSVQHLKSKFSEGFKLQIKMRKTHSDFEQEVRNVKSFVERNFPGAVLEEEHQEMLSYNIRNKSLKWSTMFGIMEQGKTSLNIEDYTLGQSNLEQVFLSFTKHQREA